MGWSDLGVAIELTNLVGLRRQLLDEGLDCPADKLWRALLDLAYVLVRLHDRLDALEWQLFPESLLHFLCMSMS